MNRLFTAARTYSLKAPTATADEKQDLLENVGLAAWASQGGTNALPQHPPTQTECHCGGMLFVLETGSKFCLNCGMDGSQ